MCRFLICFGPYIRLYPRWGCSKNSRASGARQCHHQRVELAPQSGVYNRSLFLSGSSVGNSFKKLRQTPESKLQARHAEGWGDGHGVTRRGGEIHIPLKDFQFARTGVFGILPNVASVINASRQVLAAALHLLGRIKSFKPQRQLTVVALSVCRGRLTDGLYFARSRVTSL